MILRSFLSTLSILHTVTNWFGFVLFGFFFPWNCVYEQLPDSANVALWAPIYKNVPIYQEERWNS